MSLALLWLNAAAATAPEIIDTKATCMDSCHQEFGTMSYVHSPAKNGFRCTECHEPAAPNRHAFKAAPIRIADQCEACHLPEEFHDTVLHGPVTEGECDECHVPHQSEIAGLLTKAQPELCFDCHATEQKDEKGRLLPATRPMFELKQDLQHPPFAKGECNECHEPHMSAAPRLLGEAYPAGTYARYQTRVYSLCFHCHASTAFEAARTLSDTRFRNGNLNLHHRHTNRDKGRSCGACHTAHGSDQQRLIIREFQFGSELVPVKFQATETGGSCATGCHIPLRYDRCVPEPVALRTTPREGSDATADELQQACNTEPQKARDPAQLADRTGAEKTANDQSAGGTRP
ncbi:MAG: cytochrome c3 family protein [Steroidobacteraceae bacterium]